MKINKNSCISGDFRESKLEIFPGEHSPTPPSMFHLENGVILSHCIIGCHTLSSSYILQGHFLWEIWESSDAKIIQQFFLGISRDRSVPAISENLLYFIITIIIIMKFFTVGVYT